MSKSPSRGAPSREQLDPEAGKNPWERFVASIGWLRSYGLGEAAGDLVAGAVLAVLLLPQALAYAQLAELPPQVGVFAAVAPAFAYAAFGTSRFVAVGPVALVSLLTAEAVAARGADGLAATEVAVVLAAMVGAFLLAGSWLGLARAGDFVSRPVLDGFITAVAVLIASSQLRHLVGAGDARASGFAERLSALFSATPHTATAAVGLACLALLLGAAKLLRPLLERLGVPQAVRSPLLGALPLGVLAAATAATAGLGLAERGVAVVGSIEVSLPPPTLPTGPWSLLRDLLPSALAIALVVFIVGLAVARSLAKRGGEVIPEREMAALGIANLAASVTGGLPVGASVSRSSVARDAGAKTPLAVPVAGLAALGAVFAVASWLEALPRAALSALILSAVFGLVDPARIRRTWRADRRGGVVLTVTFVAVLVLGVEWGLGIGVITSLMAHLWSTARPDVVVVGASDDDGDARGVRRDDVAEAYRSPVLVLRIDQQLYFGNSRWVRERVIEEVMCDVADEGPRCLLFDWRSVDDVDATALEMLEELFAELDDAGFDFALAEVKDPIRRKLEERLPEALRDDRWFVGLDEAIDELQARYRES